LKIERGKYWALEILQLSKLFGTPAIFWIGKDLNYTIRLNVPSHIFDFVIKKSGTLPDNYITEREGKYLHFAKGYEITINEVNGKVVNYH
jgi:hypothetical protein